MAKSKKAKAVKKTGSKTRNKPRLKKVLTMGEVARLCYVSLRTAGKWFDKGLFKGYLLPGSLNRRVHIDEFKEFMIKHDLPMDKFLKEYSHLL